MPGKDRMLTLLQHRSRDGVRRLIAARDGSAHFVPGYADTRSLAAAAIARKISLAALVDEAGQDGAVDLVDELDAGRLLAPVDHPDSAHLLLTGTGLTHLGSAESRDRMHRAAEEAQTDSMRMFLEGIATGKPGPGETGGQPEWFYKGDGTHVAGPGEPLSMPRFARDGGEEPELAGVYLIGPDGSPWRLGFCLANEFSDHVTERHNYLWLAHSKLRQAALGPELLVGECPADVRGTSRIRRNGAVVWEKPFLTGEANMSHSIANLEHHHFKYPLFRRPGDVHVHFFGTATLSFADGFRTEPGDRFEIEAAPFALPLRNALALGGDAAVTVRSL
jgi:hypothetical protein